MKALLKDNKVDLQHLKAAMVLALDSSIQNPTAIWWDGVVNGLEEDRQQYIVLQVLKDLAAKALRALSGYGITDVQVIEGSSHDLLPINVDYLENCLPQRVTRKWQPDGEEPHDEWKKSIVAQFDDLGITYAKMEFSGSGDSSNPDNWECFRSGRDSWYPKNWNDEPGRHWSTLNNYTLPTALQEEVSEYVWETLVQYDCVNNDGGGGELVIDLSNDEPVILFSVYTNEMVSTQHESETPV